MYLLLKVRYRDLLLLLFSIIIFVYISRKLCQLIHVILVLCFGYIFIIPITSFDIMRQMAFFHNFNIYIFNVDVVCLHVCMLGIYMGTCMCKCMHMHAYA